MTNSQLRTLARIIGGAAGGYGGHTLATKAYSTPNNLPDRIGRIVSRFGGIGGGALVGDELAKGWTAMGDRDRAKEKEEAEAKPKALKTAAVEDYADFNPLNGITPEQHKELGRLFAMDALKTQLNEVKWNLKKPWPLPGWKYPRPGPGAPIGRYAPAAALLGTAGLAGLIMHRRKKRKPKALKTAAALGCIAGMRKRAGQGELSPEDIADLQKALKYFRDTRDTSRWRQTPQGAHLAKYMQGKDEKQASSGYMNRGKLNLRELITDQYGVEPSQLKPDARFSEDLGADDLDNAELGLALEDIAGVDTEAGWDKNTAIGQSATVGELIKRLQAAGVKVKG